MKVQKHAISKPKHAIITHYVKRVRIRSYSATYFPTFGLNTKRYEASFRIQSQCKENKNQNNSEYGHYSRSAHPPQINWFEQFLQLK